MVGGNSSSDLAAKLFVGAFSVAPNYVYILFKIFCNHVRLILYWGDHDAIYYCQLYQIENMT